MYWSFDVETIATEITSLIFFKFDPNSFCADFYYFNKLFN